MIRKLKESDRGDFLRLIKEMYRSDAVEHEIPESCHEQNFNNLISEGAYLAGYGFELDGKLCGVALIALGYSTEAGGECVQIEDVYLTEECRGKGIFTEFLDYLTAQYPNARRFRLEVSQSNPRALALYERLGFTRLTYLQLVKKPEVSL